MIYFGVAGWSYPDWKGIVYPEVREKKFDELIYVASFVDTIELNNTFYRIPDKKVVESWVKRVSHHPGFKFTAKLFQGFTHAKTALEEEDAKLFESSMMPMLEAEKLGALLIQFPISFKNEERTREHLQDVLNRFQSFPLVVEFRHRSWIAPETFELLNRHDAGFCNVDEPVFKQMIKPTSILTGDIGYVRFHGRNYKNWFMKGGNRDTRYDYLYSEDELDTWVPRIKEMSGKGKDVYVVANNHFRGQAPANILQLKSKVIEGPVDVPDTLQKSFGELKKVARKKPGGQGGLFEE